MAKTYEALVKFKGTSGKSALPAAPLSEKPSLDLYSDKQMVDLNLIIEMKAEQDNWKIINFVSSRSGEGTSTVIVNFTRFMLESKATGDVLLIDANVQHPKLHIEFNVPQTPGLNEVLWNNAKLSDVIYKIESSNIYLIPNGSPLTYDSPSLDSRRYSSVFWQLKNRFKYIFIDSPPLLDSSAALALANIADATFIIIQAHKTRWEVVEKAKNYLCNYKCMIGGVILNRVSQPIPDWLYRRL